MLTFSSLHNLGTTYYNILVTIGSVSWTVRHRYKEFVDLHSKLVNGQSIGRDLLPPKKVNMITLFLCFLSLLKRYLYFILVDFSSTGYWESIASIPRATTKGFREIFAKSVIFSTTSHVS